MKVVNQSIRKKDAMSLVTGQPVYMDDLVPKDCLIVKLLRSPHAHAMVKRIQTDNAKKVPGIEAIYTWEDVPQLRYTNAGQTYPEPSPYDRLILDRHIRSVMDPVAIVAGEDEASVDKALKLIRVEYELLPVIYDFRIAKDNPVLVHPEEDWNALCEVGADNKRNLVASGEEGEGDIDAVLADCDVVVEGTYMCPAFNQTMMETFRTYASIDMYGRLNILSSTQIVFHVRRILSNALGIPKSMIRVAKPRIGGGFGAKQTSVSDVYPAFVTWMTKKPSKIIYTREEAQTIGSPRHQMEVSVKVGAMKDGTIRGIDMYTLSNSGAYSEHGPTTVTLSGHKAIPLYGELEAHRFRYDVVYTNDMAAGAYRGYGATQGIYALESAINELADKLHINPKSLREQNMLKEGQFMPAYYGETANACAIDRCLARAAEMIGWDEKYPCRDMGNGKVRSVGMSLAMQGSGISNVDKGSARIKLTEDGNYMLALGASDMGTGCDTILAQMAAEVMECSIDDISVFSADTDLSPYDAGSYASSTTYITGMAVQKACDALREKIVNLGAQLLSCEPEAVQFTEKTLTDLNSGKTISLQDVAVASFAGTMAALEETAGHYSPVSPPPYMVGMVEIELDKETGHVEILDYVAVVDCGTVINPNLARIQTEGGITQGIGMTLTENIQYNEKRQLMNNSFMQYKIPTRLDNGTLRVEFESSYEPTGPFGAKSIGEIVIDTPAPAINHAIANAIGGTYFHQLPITSEMIAMEVLKKE